MLIQLYNASGHDRSLDAKALPKVRLKADSLLWINGSDADVGGLTFPSRIAAAARVKPADLGAVQLHDSFYTLTLPVLNKTIDADWDALVLIVGQEWLISRGNARAVDFEHMLADEVGETSKGQLSGSTMAATLIGEHFGRVHDEIAAINREVDRLEERILTGNERRNTLHVMAVLRRRVSRLRTLVDAYRGLITTLTRPDFLPEIDFDDRQHFTHLLAGFERLEDEVAGLRDSVVESFELYATRVAQDTNRLLRTLTFLTIGIGLIGALAGIFGMNFTTGLFDEGDRGFYLAAAVMAAILIVTGVIAFLTYRRP